MQIFGDLMGACLKVWINRVAGQPKILKSVAPQQDLWPRAPLARSRLLATLRKVTHFLLQIGTEKDSCTPAQPQYQAE